MSDFVTRWLKLSLVALVGCGFVAMLVYAFWMKDEIRLTTVEPPLILAPEDPLKRRPEEPGGMLIPHQDKVVFDLLDSPSATDVAPLDEEPIMAEAVVDETPAEPVPSDAPVAEPVATPAAEPEPQPEVEEPKVATPAAPAASGNWGVQLASLSSQADAERAVKQFEGNSNLQGLTSKIARVDLGSKGVKYRVQFIGVANRTEASALCKKLKVSCLPVEAK